MCTMANWEMDADNWINALSMRSKANGRECIGKVLLAFVLALSSGCLIPALAATEGQVAVSDAAQRQAPRHHNRPSLEERAETLSQALGLDATQQSELRKVLEGQREQVRRIWSDASVPAAYRVSATQAISDKTADQIRALLNDEQKKKYNPPRPPHEAAESSAKPSVETWLYPAKPK
jgi:hypothetical protein